MPWLSIKCICVALDDVGENEFSTLIEDPSWTGWCFFWNLVADLHVQRDLRGNSKFWLLLVKVQIMLLSGSNS